MYLVFFQLEQNKKEASSASFFYRIQPIYLYKIKFLEIKLVLLTEAQN